MNAEAVRQTVNTLLDARRSGATICPSEVARALSETGWRDLMPDIHAVVDTMVAERTVVVSWKGRLLPERNGPYRIGKPA